MKNLLLPHVGNKEPDMKGIVKATVDYAVKAFQLG